MKVRFSIRRRLIMTFSLLILATVSVLGLTAIALVRQAMIDKVHTQLVEKAEDTAKIINERLTSYITTLVTVARHSAPGGYSV